MFCVFTREVNLLHWHRCPRHLSVAPPQGQTVERTNPWVHSTGGQIQSWCLKKKKKSAKGKCLGETNSDVYWKPTFKYLLNEVCLEDMKESSVVLSCFRNCYLHSYLPYTCVQVKEGMSYIYVSIFHLNLIQLGV